MNHKSQVSYTKKLLNDSLLDELKENPISRVTVSSLCKRVDMNRSTYYKYFANPYDQLDKMEKRFFSELAKLNRKDPQSHATDFERVRSICEFFYENRKFFLCLSNNCGMGFVAKTYDALKDIVFAQWNAQHYKYRDSTQDFSLTYVLAGSLGILHRWLLEDAALFAPSQMAEILLEYNNTGLRGVSSRTDSLPGNTER